MEQIALPPHLHVFPDFAGEEANEDKKIGFSSCNPAAAIHKFQKQITHIMWKQLITENI